MNNSRFTYKYYDMIINKISQKGYSFTNYHKYNEIERPCIIKHDVDYDILKAKDFAI